MRRLGSFLLTHFRTHFHIPDISPLKTPSMKLYKPMQGYKWDFTVSFWKFYEWRDKKQHLANTIEYHGLTLSLFCFISPCVWSFRCIHLEEGVGCGHMFGGSHPSDPLTVTEDKLLFSFHVDCPQKWKGEMLCIKTWSKWTSTTWAKVWLLLLEELCNLSSLSCMH